MSRIGGNIALTIHIYWQKSMIGNGPMMPGGNVIFKVVLVLVTLIISGIWQIPSLKPI